MNVVIVTSLLLRLAAAAWAAALYLRTRDRWFACLVLLIGLFAARPLAAVVLSEAWLYEGPGGFGEFGALLASLLMLATVALLSRWIDERDRAERGLAATRRALEQRIARRTTELEESEAKFRQLAEHIDAVFWLSDMDENRPLYISPGFESVFGHSYEELGTDTGAWMQVVHPDDRDRVERAYLSTFSGNEFDEEFRIILPDGRVRWLRDQAFTVRNGSPTPHLMAGLASDITEMKLTEEALRETNEELEVFAQTISHDLKAPLRAIEGFAVALGEDYGPKLDQRARDYLSLIADGAGRMDSLLNDLLEHARVGRKIVDEQLDVGAVVERVVENLKPVIQGAGASVTVEGDLHEVAGHRGLLETMLQNLISNAIKFVPGDRTPEVVIGARPVGTSYRLFVRDNGIGIDPQHQERIFSIFERLHAREAYPGTGVGLAIVKKAARLHDGDVTVESSPGRGSTFWVTLPRYPTPAPAQSGSEQRA